MGTENVFFKLFACCIPVKGIKRSIICDIQRGNFEYIPMGLYEILSNCEKYSIKDIYLKYTKIEKGIIDEYFEWLEEKEFGFITTDPKRFPKIDLKFKTPEVINNAIIDIDENSNHPYENIFKQLDELGCKFIELRSFIALSHLTICNILKHTQKLRFRNIDFITKYNNTEEIPNDLLTNIFMEFPNLKRIIFHTCENDVETELMQGRLLVHIKQKIISENCCGNISINNFSVNIQSFTESQSANTCLNKKVSIDKMGNLKNCPSMIESYGNISDTSVAKILETTNFKQIWSLSKNKISICKVCEFRHICTDCRAFLPKEEMYNKPFKCNYNPYNATWEN
jgi:SPASM domain peptide maturase of grasp-with-spasm system